MPNTGTVSTNAAAPTLVTLTLQPAIVIVKNNGSSTGTIIYGPNVAALDSTKDSTLEPGASAPVIVPSGVVTLAFASTGGAATADIQISQLRR